MTAMLSIALTRLNDPMPMLMPPLKWMCVLLSFSLTFVTFAKAWQSLVRETTSHFNICLKCDNVLYFLCIFSVSVYGIISPTKATSKLLTCKSDNCFGFSSLLWWSRLYSHPGTWELLSAKELRHSTVLHASLLSTRTSSYWILLERFRTANISLRQCTLKFILQVF